MSEAEQADAEQAVAERAEPAAPLAADEPQLGYEQARAELREIVRALETGGQPLEESLALWQRGEKLAAVCQRWLQGAREQLDSAIAASEDAPH